MALLAVACDDDLSPIGGSIQPPSDPVSARVDTLEFSVKTIPMGDIYNRTNYTLLGDLTDHAVQESEEFQIQVSAQRWEDRLREAQYQL